MGESCRKGEAGKLCHKTQDTQGVPLLLCRFWPPVFESSPSNRSTFLEVRRWVNAFHEWQDKVWLRRLIRIHMHSVPLSVVDSKSFRFYADSNYLFVSRQNFTSNTQVNVGKGWPGGSAFDVSLFCLNGAIVQFDQATRRFYVSTDFDGATVTFKQMQLPAAHWQDVSLASVGSTLSVPPPSPSFLPFFSPHLSLPLLSMFLW